MSTDTPPPDDPDLQALDRLVGTWEISGEATGLVIYRWLPGRYFLLQEGELELFNHRNVFTEIIGREKPFGSQPSTDIKSRTYTAAGDTLDYIYELHDDTLTIWGGHRDSDNYFQGTLSDNDATLTGRWTWPGGGYSTTSTQRTRQGVPRN